MTEDLNVYEEGENFHLDGMVHQSNELVDEKSQHACEERALESAQEIVELLHRQFADHAVEGTWGRAGKIFHDLSDACDTCCISY